MDSPRFNLTDTSPMIFGKYEGIPMAEVPVNYLHYLWHHGLKYENGAVSRYIRENLDALRKENSEVTW